MGPRRLAVPVESAGGSEMSCTLTREPGGVFTAPVGSQVEIDIRSERPAETVRISYAGDQDGEAPFEFTVKEGKHVVLVVALGVEERQRMTLVEISGEDECPLKRFTWSTTNFSTSIAVKGV